MRSIAFEGVPADQLHPLAGHLPVAEGAPLTEENLKRSLRALYATGLYDTIEARATRMGDGVALIFAGTPRTFIGTVERGRRHRRHHEHATRTARASSMPEPA